jgi:hypothetical protein
MNPCSFLSTYASSAVHLAFWGILYALNSTEYDFLFCLHFTLFISHVPCTSVIFARIEKRIAMEFWV